MDHQELLAAYARLAEEVGIALPPVLAQLLAAGKTQYAAAGSANWKTRYLQDPPALISCGDFEWVDAEQSRDTVAEWLHPRFQAGRSFLPFAQSGAGDAYCLVRHEDGAYGVACVWHDRGDSAISHAGLEDFLCSQLLPTFADLSHLVGDGFTPDEALDLLRRDVAQVAAGLDAQRRHQLLELLALAPISHQRLARELPRFSLPQALSFDVRPRWECEDAPVPPKAVTWMELARDPARKLQAIRACQAAHNLSLARAKAAVDQYLADHVPL